MSWPPSPQGPPPAGTPWTGAGGPPPFTPPPRVPAAELRPRRRWYAVPGVLVAAGVVAAIVLLALTITGALADLEELPGGRGTVALDAGEERGLYAADAPVVDPSASAVAPATCTITGPDGREVDSRLALESFSVGVNGTDWDSFGRFEARVDGPHRFACTGGARVAVGPEPDVVGLLASIFLSFALAALGVLAGIVSFFVVLLLRVRDRRRRERIA